jgi:hypothetical protein
MIEMLLALPLVATGRLKMAVVERTNPNVVPCRRDDQRTDSLERVPIADYPAGDGAVTKPVPASLAANAGTLVGHVTQADGLRRLRRGRRGVGVRIDACNMPSKAMSSTAATRSLPTAIRNVHGLTEWTLFLSK